MSNATRRIADHQAVFVREATILRKNLYEWDQVLRDPRGEDWPSMLGRLNAAMVRACRALSSRLIIVLHCMQGLDQLIHPKKMNHFQFQMM